MPVKYDIFISYRRKGGYDTAKLLYDRLRMEGYSVSFDIDTLEKGDFDKELESRVRDCKDFLVVMSSGIFDRFFTPDHDPKDDWVRREIACALVENKNIVPIILDGFNWPKEALPADVAGLAKKNGIDLNPKHFEAAYANLKRKFLDSKPLWTIKYKKEIITGLFFVLVATAVLFYLGMTEYYNKTYSEKDFVFQLEKRKSDSLLRVNDSIIKRQDSLRSAREKQRAIRQDSLVQASKSQPELTKVVKVEKAEKTPDKTLHWNGPNDPVGRAIFEKLQPLGVQRTKCSNNGINISTTSPNCTIARGNIECSYSPKFSVTDCNGKLLGILDASIKFRTEPHTEELAAREELANELRNTNFSDVIEKIREIP